MKIILAVSIFFILFAASSYADDEAVPTKDYIEIRLGFADPWDAGLGFKGGVLAGYRFDKVVSINADLDYYRASFTTPAGETNTGTGFINSTSLASQTTANLYMLFVNVRVDIPYVIADVIQPYIQAGVGYDMMYNTYENISNTQSDLFAGDFLAFQIEIGGQIALGEMTYLYLMAGYMFSDVEKSQNPNDTLSVLKEINVSGFSVLCGIGFKL